MKQPHLWQSSHGADDADVDFGGMTAPTTRQQQHISMVLLLLATEMQAFLQPLLPLLTAQSQGRSQPLGLMLLPLTAQTQGRPQALWLLLKAQMVRRLQPLGQLLLPLTAQTQVRPQSLRPQLLLPTSRMQGHPQPLMPLLLAALACCPPQMLGPQLLLPTTMQAQPVHPPTQPRGHPWSRGSPKRTQRVVVGHSASPTPP